MNAEFGAIFGLSVDQKLRLVEDLWDSIGATPEEVPVPQWQKDELARRKAEFLRNPDSAIPWEEALERLRAERG